MSFVPCPVCDKPAPWSIQGSGSVFASWACTDHIGEIAEDMMLPPCDCGDSHQSPPRTFTLHYRGDDQ